MFWDWLKRNDKKKDDAEYHSLYKDSTKELAPERNEFILGERFPWKEYSIPGDFCVTVPNQDSFDVVLSLPNCTEEEMKAVAEGDLIVAIKEYHSVPLLVFSFDGKMSFDASLNILKIKEQYQRPWISSHGPKNMNIFLLEGTDATLIAVKSFCFDGMDIIKAICKDQLLLRMEDVDTIIKMAQQSMSIADIFNSSDVKYLIRDTKRML